MSHICVHRRALESTCTLYQWLWLSDYLNNQLFETSIWLNIIPLIIEIIDDSKLSFSPGWKDCNIQLNNHEKSEKTILSCSKLQPQWSHNQTLNYHLCDRDNWTLNPLTVSICPQNRQKQFSSQTSQIPFYSNPIFWFLAAVVQEGIFLNQSLHVMSKFCCANGGIHTKLRSRVWNSETAYESGEGGACKSLE